VFAQVPTIEQTVFTCAKLADLCREFAHYVEIVYGIQIQRYQSLQNYSRNIMSFDWQHVDYFDVHTASFTY